MCPKLDMRHKPNVINAEYLDNVCGGESNFLILDGEEYTTAENKVLNCILLQEIDGTTILYNPNRTAMKKLTDEGLTDTDQMKGYVLTLHTEKVLFGSDETRGVRIKEIIKPKPEQKKL